MAKGNGSGGNTRLGNRRSGDGTSILNAMGRFNRPANSHTSAVNRAIRNVNQRRRRQGRAPVNASRFRG